MHPRTASILHGPEVISRPNVHRQGRHNTACLPRPATGPINQDGNTSTTQIACTRKAPLQWRFSGGATGGRPHCCAMRPGLPAWEACGNLPGDVSQAETFPAARPLGHGAPREVAPQPQAPLQWLRAHGPQHADFGLQHLCCAAPSPPSGTKPRLKSTQEGRHPRFGCKNTSFQSSRKRHCSGAF